MPEALTDALRTQPPRFPPYPTYKDSGVEWLGEIPAHWKVKRLWHLTPSHRRIMYGIVLPGPNVEEGVPIVKGGDVSAERLRLDCLNRTTCEIESGYIRSRLQGGDLVFAIRGSIGEVAIVPDELEGANLTQDAARVAYTPATQGRWLLYALKSAAIFAQLEAGALGATIRGVNIRDLKRASMPVPPRPEQEGIAAFLDRETARIDALVAKNERLSELLQEKRSALITRAVTKGLDASAPMKDSGIGWLEEIPAHWEVKPVKRIFTNLDSRRIPLSGEERATMAKEYPYYGASGIIDQVENYLFDESLILVAEDGANLYSRSSPLAFVATGKYWVNNHAHILKPLDGKISFWAHTLGSVVFDPWISGSAQPKLTSEGLGSIPLPIPPAIERDTILAAVDRHTVQLDVLIAKVREAILRLEELRTALISVAVTGKIDVREDAARAGPCA